MESLKLGELFQKLRPRILDLISLSGGGPGPFAPSPHDLNSAHHSGTLADAQMPTVLLRDGSRSLLNNLAVADGKTIDGVDLSAHASNVAAHHEPVTIVDTGSINLSLSGQQLSGSVNYGTPSGLSASSTNAIGSDSTAAKSDHIHAIAASADVSGVSAETLLKCTAAGGLTLKQLYVTGDFSVGVNVLKVQTSVGNVGINCVPDSQFDLDVAGNLRAQGWIVGKHAIQVKDAKMICHFDGSKTPGDITFNPTGHMGQVAAQSGTAYGGVGKFGKGATFINELTNIVINPSVEIDTTGYSSQSNSTIARTGADSAFGNYSLLVTPSHATSNNGVRYQVSLTSGQSYAFSSSFKGKSGLKYRVNFLNSSFVSIAYTEIVSNGDWQRVGVVHTAPSTGTYHLQVQPYDNGADFTPFNVDGYLLTNTAYVSPYFDGSFQDCSWSSTAHASTSTSTMGRLTFNNNTVPISNGTVCYWLKIDALTNGAYGQTIFRHGTDGADFWMYIRPTDGHLLYAWGTSIYSAGSFPIDGAFHFVAMTRDNTDTKVYIDGVLVGQVSSSAFTKHSTNPLDIGSLSLSGERATNGTIDEFAIIDRPLTADEIKAIYESDAPIFSETSNWSWRTENNLAWADANGLWAVDKNAAHAFGVCGVDGYSWGGFGLDAGDIVMGRNGSGSSAIKWDISSGKFGFYGDGDGTPRVEIDTNGELSFSNGEMLMSDYGLRFFGSGVSATTRAIRWYDNSSGDRVLGQIRADYGGSGGLGVTWLLSFKNSGDPWSRPETIIAAIDNTTSVDTRLNISTESGGRVQATKKMLCEEDLYLRRRVTDPATLTNYGILYVYDNSLKYRKPNGTIVTIVT